MITIAISGAAACRDDATETDFIPVAAAATAPSSRTTPATAAVAPTANQEEEISPRLLRRFSALTPPMLERPALVELGRTLYYEPRLSKTRLVSCNSCHPLDSYGVTIDAVSKGVNGKTGTRNAPTTYHAAGHFRQFWDGRAATLSEQAKGPITNDVEMGLTPAQAVATVKGVPGYAALFKAAFPDDKTPITFDNLATAIGAFEVGLVTPSRWDRYLGGDTKALTPREKDGAKLFANLGCMVCHTGRYIGGSMFEKLGVQQPWPNQKDRGRREFTKQAVDDMIFKVPSLRNIAKTAPYFHDGSVKTLNEAVHLMARHQLGSEVTDEEAAQIVAWLGSLTGEIPQVYIAAPSLPQ